MRESTHERQHRLDRRPSTTSINHSLKRPGSVRFDAVRLSGLSLAVVKQAMNGAEQRL